MTKLSIYTLFSDPLEYVNARKIKARNEAIIYRTIFVVLNLTIALAAATIAILTAFMFSLLLYGGNKPTWFFFTATGVAAATTMITSFINFFIIQGRYQGAIEVHKKIIGQITLYINNVGFYKEETTNSEILLYTRVAQICGNTDAIGEISDEFKELEEEIKKTRKTNKNEKR